VFKSATATIYGPGLWGHRTACGERLRKTTLGVANRTLKCGTKVAVYYGDRELVVPVIDRGPFTKHASWDLTEATANALGATHTVTVGTIAPWSPSQQSSARS
jgi:rare lipoprotein A